MRKVSKASVRKIISNGSRNIIISERAAGAIATLLERKAKKISKYAVQRARKNGRSTITEEDINSYRLRFGD